MSEGKLVKPQLRNLHRTKLKGNLIKAVTIAIAAGMTFKFIICDPHHQRVEEFYKTYDPVKSLQRMNDSGLMESAE